jgi:glycosyltransferase involved in cell wall biosynthesis
MQTYEQQVSYGLATYLRSYENYKKHRLKYYSDVRSITSVHRRLKFFSFSRELESEGRLRASYDIANSRSGLVITTSTKNRGYSLAHSYAKLASQTFSNWQWLIVDNGSSDGTKRVIDSFGDKRILYASYTEAGGCAYPVRNCAFDIVTAGLQNRHARLPWVINLDSDDHLYDEFSLAEIYKVIGKARGEKTAPLLCHGLAAWRTEGVSGPEVITCPSDTYAQFPLVPKAQFLYDRGLTVLSGAYSPWALAWLRYPNEFSFEDNGLNVKLILESNRSRLGIRGIAYPIVAKNDSKDNMIAKNNAIGDSSQVEFIGGHKAIGVRATIVRYLNKLRDYYHENNL